MTGPTNFEVSGGSGGVEAEYEDLLAMSDVTDEVAQDGLATAVQGHKYLVEPDVLASALLNPVGVAQFEAAMALALDGAQGLTVTSGSIALRGTALRTAKDVYELTDALAAEAFDTSRWFAGKLLTSNPGTATTAALLAGGTIAADVYLNYDGDWERWLVDHPGMVDDLVAMSPGMLSSLGIPMDLAAALDLLAATYPDGELAFRRVNEHKVLDTNPPDSLENLLDGLNTRNEADDSNIDVRIIRDANGDVTGYVVDVPGTKNWNPPGTEVSANDLGVNIDAMAGNNTVLQRGIEAALRDAGAHETEAPVMLVGHSQGGIVAAEATDDLVGSGYNVTHVVTAGSPVGRIDMPDDVHVLSLENRNDIVPHLDASDNPDSPNRTTVEFDNNTGRISGDPVKGTIGNHDIAGNYTDAARHLDTSSDPSVRRYRDSMGTFTGGDEEESEIRTYQADRKGVDD